MSRIVCIKVPRAEVISACGARHIEISMVESLVSGGSRVVFNNALDASVIAEAYKREVINEPVRRTLQRFRG